MRRSLILAALTMMSGSGFAQVRGQATARRPQRILSRIVYLGETPAD
ncbi:MAG TPA: hypothetical protein VGV87_04280 [Blastocatellia bacterium]|jgi:hypothetical protein|nr:hypothetical protein [Blastocatellia bacterium]